jgi:hypothetical protein
MNKSIRCSACYYSIVLQVWPIPTSTPLESKRQNTINKSKRIPFIFNDESTGSCICLGLDLYMSRVKKYNRYARHIHDPVLSSLKMKGIRLLFLKFPGPCIFIYSNK